VPPGGPLSWNAAANNREGDGCIAGVQGERTVSLQFRVVGVWHDRGASVSSDKVDSRRESGGTARETSHRHRLCGQVTIP
jgi:hypothetical protein